MHRFFLMEKISPTTLTDSTELVVSCANHRNVWAIRFQCQRATPSVLLEKKEARFAFDCLFGVSFRKGSWP